MNPITRRRLLLGIPLATAALAGGGFVSMLSGLRKGSFDPHAINIPIINRKIPDFSLTPLPNHTVFDSNQLASQQKPVLINFFASWCLPCVGEMPLLQELTRKISIWGIGYKDSANSIEQFLARHANPYTLLGMDQDGMVGINWGISGVPESFLVMPEGIIKWHYPKPLDKTALQVLLSLAKQA